MNSIYPLTYLLFKHGTICHRRMNESTNVILYRTFFLAFIMADGMSINGFTASLPVKNLMLIMFIVLVSPLQIVLFGISHRDVGYDYLYRIYGEY
jgi:magnesium-transporting ATPase (P-type)